jgi:hypothetical protein
MNFQKFMDIDFEKMDDFKNFFQEDENFLS